jgi:pimeloyl-ACP methyl ester carboxylesterase
MDIQPLQATTADGVTLRGELVRGDASFVVCVHDVGEDIDAWKPIRNQVAREGWTILALDLRGHGGSDGEWTGERGELDVDVGVTVARRMGASHVAVLACGEAAIFTLQALERAHPVEALELPDSLVLISPGPLNGIDPMSVRGRGLSKLFLFGAKDPHADDAGEIVKASIGWKVQATYGTSARSAALVEERARLVADKTVSFLREQFTLPGPGYERARQRAESSGESS